MVGMVRRPGRPGGPQHRPEVRTNPLERLIQKFREFDLLRPLVFQHREAKGNQPPQKSQDAVWVQTDQNGNTTFAVIDIASSRSTPDGRIELVQTNKLAHQLSAHGPGIRTEDPEAILNHLNQQAEKYQEPFAGVVGDIKVLPPAKISVKLAHQGDVKVWAITPDGKIYFLSPEPPEEEIQAAEDFWDQLSQANDAGLLHGKLRNLYIQITSRWENAKNQRIHPDLPEKERLRHLQALKNAYAEYILRSMYPAIKQLHGHNKKTLTLQQAAEKYKNQLNKLIRTPHRISATLPPGTTIIAHTDGIPVPPDYFIGNSPKKILQLARKLKKDDRGLLVLRTPTIPQNQEHMRQLAEILGQLPSAYRQMLIDLAKTQARELMLEGRLAEADYNKIIAGALKQLSVAAKRYPPTTTTRLRATFARTFGRFVTWLPNKIPSDITRYSRADGSRLAELLKQAYPEILALLRE